MTALHISYTGVPGRWTGVLKDDDGRVVAECGHTHTNRDEDGHAPAAVPCITLLVREVILGKVVEREAEAERKYEKERQWLKVSITDRAVEPMVRRALELAPIVGQGPVFCRGKLVAVANADVLTQWKNRKGVAK